MTYREECAERLAAIILERLGNMALPFQTSDFIEELLDATLQPSLTADRLEGGARCRYCLASIIWGHTNKGSRAPFDVNAPFVNHFSTCSHPDEARKR